MTGTATTAMDLRRLLSGLASAPPAVEVADVAMHSGEVVPGGLFLACAGTRTHGLRFLADAIGRGARAVAWEPVEGVGPPSLPAGVVGVVVPGLGRRLGDIANAFFARPSATVSVTGITGTNGKTTVAWLVMQALGRLGRRAGYMGTLGYGMGDAISESALTTPGCIGVHRRLRELADRGATHVAMEVSSHALDQGRVDGVSFRVVAFTNLSRDHLDYHGDLASYGRAKERLFRGHGAAGAVINIGDEFGRGLAARIPVGMRLVTVASASATPALLEARRAGGRDATGPVQLRHGGREAACATALPGAFNVENIAVAAGILLADGFELDAVATALAACTAPPGRMEVINAGDGPSVVVDFAHSPDALRRVLGALRSQVAGELWCVFGCGGERDRGKRAAMGAVARELADRIVVTDDNPRGEDPVAITSAILEGTGGGPGVEVIHDREAAIRRAIRAAAPGDVVLVAGKGHEAVQVTASGPRPFSDQAVARKALAART